MSMQFEQFDGAYVDRLRSGDCSTQQHFVSYFGELIRLKAGKWLKSMEAIEDVRQETFARVFRVLTENRISQPKCLGSFVNSVCNNVLREQYRSSCREIPAAEELVAAIPDTRIGISEAMALRQMQQAVRQILGMLSKKERGLMEALFLEERDKDEVCREFGVNREYLRVMVHRAKQSFKMHYLKAVAGSRVGSSERVSAFSVRSRAHHTEPLPPVRTLSLRRNSTHGRRSKETLV